MSGGTAGRRSDAVKFIHAHIREAARRHSWNVTELGQSHAETMWAEMTPDKANPDKRLVYMLKLDEDNPRKSWRPVGWSAFYGHVLDVCETAGVLELLEQNPERFPAELWLMVEAKYTRIKPEHFEGILEWHRARVRAQTETARDEQLRAAAARVAQLQADTEAAKLAQLHAYIRDTWKKLDRMDPHSGNMDKMKHLSRVIIGDMTLAQVLTVVKPTPDTAEDF